MITINTYLPGTNVDISGIPGEPHQTWAILAVSIELTESGNTYAMVQMLTLLAVDDNGEDVGKEPVRINSDMYDIREI